VQIGSLLREAGKTKQQMEAFCGTAIPERVFTRMGHHIAQHGVGAAFPVQEPAPRGVSRTVETVKKFVDFLIASGVLTANTRQVKNTQSEVSIYGTGVDGYGSA
jgi:hypothetical protein